MKLENKVICFLGDSITEGHGTSTPDKKFSELIYKRCKLAAAYNYGIGGSRIARQQTKSENPRWDMDFCGRFSEMKDNADIVFVFGGTNDYGHGDAPIGEFSDRTPDTFYGGLHYLMSGRIEKYPEAVIVFATPLHRGGDTSTRDGRPDLKGFRDMIKEVAEYYSLPVLDLWSMSGLSTNSPVICERYVPDKLHPNDAGHVVLADRIIGFLESL